MVALIEKLITRFRRSRFDQRQIILSDYSKTLSNHGLTFLFFFKTSIRLILFSVTSLESIFLIATYAFLLSFVGAFLRPDGMSTFVIVGFLLTMLCIGLVIIMLVSSLVLPLKFKFRLRPPVVNLITSTIAAVSLTILTPEVWRFFSTSNEVGTGIVEIFIGFFILAYFSMTIVYVYNSEVMDYNNYRQFVDKKSVVFDLPPEVRGRILSVKARDHYVEITTDMGKHMVRMRMSDALEKLIHLNGVQTHRSYWVAKGHISKIEKSGSKLTAHLRTGEEIPISAKNLAEVKDWMKKP